MIGGSPKKASLNSDQSKSNLSLKVLEENEDIIASIVENMQIGRLDDCMQQYLILQNNLVAMAAELDNFPTEDQDAYAMLHTLPDRVMRKDTLDDFLPFEERKLPPLPLIPECTACFNNQISAKQCREVLHHVETAYNLNEDEELQFLQASQVLLARHRFALSDPKQQKAKTKKVYKKWSIDENYTLLLALATVGKTTRSVLPLLPNRTESQVRHRIAKIALDYSDGVIDINKVLLEKPEKYVPPPALAYLFTTGDDDPQQHALTTTRAAVGTTTKPADIKLTEEKAVAERQNQNDFAALIAAAANMQLDSNDCIIHPMTADDDYKDDDDKADPSSMTSDKQSTEVELAVTTAAVSNNTSSASNSTSSASNSSSNAIANMPITSLIAMTQDAVRTQQPTQPAALLPSIARVLNGPNNRQLQQQSLQKKQTGQDLAEKSLQQLMSASRDDDHDMMDTSDPFPPPLPPPPQQQQQQQQQQVKVIKNDQQYRDLLMKENAKKAEALLDFYRHNLVAAAQQQGTQVYPRPGHQPQPGMMMIMPPPAPRFHQPQPQHSQSQTQAGNKQPPPFARQGIQRLKAQQQQVQQQLQQQKIPPPRPQLLPQPQPVNSSYRSPIANRTRPPLLQQQAGGGDHSPDDSEYLQSLIDSPHQHPRGPTAAVTATTTATASSASMIMSQAQRVSTHSQQKKKPAASSSTKQISAESTNNGQQQQSFRAPMTQAKEKAQTQIQSNALSAKETSNKENKAASSTSSSSQPPSSTQAVQDESDVRAITSNHPNQLYHHQQHHSGHNLRFMSPTQDSMLLTEGGEGLQGIVIGEELSFL